jgi:hypothetical protein
VGGFALVALVVWRHRSSLRFPSSGASKTQAPPSPGSGNKKS